DLEEAGLEIAAALTVFEAANGEELVSGAHDRGAAPRAAIVVVDGVDVVVPRHQLPGQQGLATVRLDVPPALARPAGLVLVAQRHPDLAVGVVAQLQSALAGHLRRP